MNRDAAIEAVQDVLVEARYPVRYRTELQDLATLIIDAAAPHLVGEPVGYGTINERGELIADGLTLDQARSLCEHRNRWANVTTARVVALVPVEDQP